ncbi:MCE family protein [Mycolicibacterium mucogenicum]|uniref:MCE family protein n=1 Tax=Mycolicibacterium mucogenicum DSM 44124 TaxID=1226753 RepID=A0A8H2JDW1_MYCMU|nr:MCE family protein [Mycolicibacterium mucogenicum]KAB7758612.1 mammalian cell entry protein [Mycolicibacterium mucogenicum DSM 44124]QPG67655.1 MCE family protein [Mycolicibacterium mucogenicum DSM 44124]
MITRHHKPLTRIAAALLVVLALAGGVLLVRQTVFRPTAITAYFTSATAIYPGDEVRVAGVKVGTITSIEPAGSQARLTLAIDHGVPIRADAKAIIMAQNLVAARYVQLAPAYDDAGPTMSDGAQIGIDRTAVPVEWDQVKDQLMRLATDLGPVSGSSATSLSRFIDSAATAMDSNGDKLHQAISQLSGIGRILAHGSGNVVDIIKNLQIFVSALRESNTQIVEFQQHLASVTSVVNGARTDLDAALTNLASAVGEVRRFVAGTRDQTVEQLQRLTNVTQNLVDNKLKLENVLHVAPNAIANGYNIYNPDSGTAVGAFAMSNFADPVSVVCSAIAAVKNATAAESSKLCAQYLGPALSLINFNYLPLPTNVYLRKAPSPENLVYTDPKLAPGGSGSRTESPTEPPAVSAYTGTNDVTPPAGWGAPPGPPGAYAPNGLPADPAPALFPGAPIPQPPAASAPQAITVRDLLLPAEAAPASTATTPGGTP